MGICEKSAKQFIDTREYPLTDPATQRPAGTIRAEEYKVIEKPSFLDYLRGGWGISLQVAIDFTGSNGEYHKPDSLHYLGGNNQYEHAIRSVGTILEAYDSDKSFPVYGFGGIPRYMGAAQVSHCFPLNGNLQNPEVLGTEKVLELYRQVLPVSIEMN